MYLSNTVCELILPPYSIYTINKSRYFPCVDDTFFSFDGYTCSCQLSASAFCLLSVYITPETYIAHQPVDLPECASEQHAKNNN